MNSKEALITEGDTRSFTWEVFLQLFQKLKRQQLQKLKNIYIYTSKRKKKTDLELMKMRKINNPNLFLNKSVLVVGIKFLEEIRELYDEF